MKKKREALTEQAEDPHGIYFTESSSLKLIHSGSTLLDCVLGGGYPLGRVVNIVGDKAVGKTLLAIEAAVNFINQFNGDVYYNETESAFDPKYAKRLGLPIERVAFIEGCRTVENFYNDLSEKLKKHTKSKRPAIYIIDSLDALSNVAEMEREIGAATYGQEKAKQLSQTFRRVVQEIEESELCLFIISQVRDDIGAMFGRKVKRSGGRALDFYASQVIYLAHLKRLTKQIQGIKRAHGVVIKATCDKNKVGLPFRDCEFPIEFSYGIDDLDSCLEWLHEINALDKVGLDKASAQELRKGRFDPSKVNVKQTMEKIRPVVIKLWQEIDDKFCVKISKY